MALENKVHFNLEAKFEKPVKMLENLFSAHEFLIPLSLQMSKYKYEFWHMVTVPLAYKGIVNKFAESGIINKDTDDFLQTGIASAHLHDIGKFAIVKGSITKSLDAMNYVNPDFVPSESQFDGRTPAIKAAQHLHPLVGGYMINHLIDVGLIPPEIGAKIKSGVFTHHETERDSFKSPYPRRVNGRRLENKDRRQVLSDFLIMLADVAVSMRSIRPYRKRELDYSIIEKELGLYLGDRELLEYIKPLFNGKDIKEIKNILQKNIRSSIDEIDDVIRVVPDLNQIDWNGYIEVPEAIQLENVISNVWDDNWGALDNAFTREYEKGSVHRTRVAA